MLVMRRREGESILIGEDIEIRILSIDRSKVKIGITAPREIPVVTREMELVRRENQAAACVSGDAARSVACLLQASFPLLSAENSPNMADVKDVAKEEDSCPLVRLPSPE